MNAPSNEPGTAQARRRSPWPFAIAGLLAAHVGAMALAVHIAGGSAGDKVLPEYAERNVSWDEVRATAERSAALGWALEVTPATLCDADGGRRFTLELRDAAGDPVVGAAVRVRAYHRSVGVRHEAAAEPVERGVYAATLPLGQPGMHELEVTATLEDLVFVDTRAVPILGVTWRAEGAPLAR